MGGGVRSKCDAARYATFLDVNYTINVPASYDRLIRNTAHTIRVPSELHHWSPAL